MERRTFFSLSCLLVLALFSTSIAECKILPYQNRTRDFGAWTPATRGDINTVGMSGATLAVPVSISAAETNPAAYAMMTASVSAQIIRMSFTDEQLQRSGEKIESTQLGLGVSPPHRGFSIAYYSPQTETGTYASPNTRDTARMEVSLKEFRLTAAQAFFDDRLALGASLDMLKAIREINEESSNAIGFSYHLGALFRLPRHFILGASFTPRTTVGPSEDPGPQTIMPGFNRSTVRPMLASFGAGWVPNRFFRLGFSVTYASATENTALMSDESVLTGLRPTWIPRVGASYVFTEYNNLKIEGAVGSYWEKSRLTDSNSRIHATGGIEVQPYFINLGTGIDVSDGYLNVMALVGFDIVRAARAFEIVPKDPVPALGRSWPRPDEVIADGLPMGVTNGEPRQYGTTSVGDVGKIIEDVPTNISKKIAGEKTTVVIKEEQKKKEKNSKTGARP